MNRRQVLSGVGLLAAAAAAAQPDRSGSSVGTVDRALVGAASDCVSKGQVCLSHCHEMLANGDKSMAACAKTVSELLAVCGALVAVAAQGAPSLPKLAAVAFDVCTRCEAECRKHAQHPPCKDCAEACVAVQLNARKPPPKPGNFNASAHIKVWLLASTPSRGVLAGKPLQQIGRANGFRCSVTRMRRLFSVAERP